MTLQQIADKCIRHIKDNKPMDIIIWQELVSWLECEQYGEFVIYILDAFSSGVLVNYAKQMIKSLNLRNGD